MSQGLLLPQWVFQRDIHRMICIRIGQVAQIVEWIVESASAQLVVDLALLPNWHILHQGVLLHLGALGEELLLLLHLIVLHLWTLLRVPERRVVVPAAHGVADNRLLEAGVGQILRILEIRVVLIFLDFLLVFLIGGRINTIIAR